MTSHAKSVTYHPSLRYMSPMVDKAKAAARQARRRKKLAESGVASMTMQFRLMDRPLVRDLSRMTVRDGVQIREAMRRLSGSNEPPEALAADQVEIEALREERDRLADEADGLRKRAAAAERVIAAAQAPKGVIPWLSRYMLCIPQPRKKPRG